MLSFITNCYAAKVYIIGNKIIFLLIVAVTTTNTGGLSRKEDNVVAKIYGPNSFSLHIFYYIII